MRELRADGVPATISLIDSMVDEGDGLTRGLVFNDLAAKRAIERANRQSVAMETESHGLVIDR